MAVKRIEIVIDDALVAADADQNLLAACLAAGQEVPYFCWHPALGSVGSCRQCAVKLFSGPDDKTGQIVMACMTPVTVGMRVSVADDQTADFRKTVVEDVLTNHPHDCPVCDVAGECHLQDMTVLTGHHTRRYRFAKRTHLNQELGPFIRHEMNRCIGCYRCVRFYRDYAGGDDFGVFGANRNIYFGRAGEGTLESPFAGNLVEVCPTGVFTDKPFASRFRRKWDMRSTPSICTHCAVGCNVTINEREGQFRRVVNRFNPEVNGFFLCDRGRFGMSFTTARERVRQSWRRSRPDTVETITHDEAISALARLLRHPGIIGIGSPRSSVEANLALRQIVGAENFFAGVSAHDHDLVAAAVAILKDTTVPIADMAAIEQSDAVLLVGNDPTDCAPRIALALRQALEQPTPTHLAERHIPAWQDEAARALGREFPIPLGILSSLPTTCDTRATCLLRETPDKIEAAARQLLAELGGPEIAAAPETGLAGLFASSERPLIVVGGGSVSSALFACAANIATALRAKGQDARLVMMLPKANSLGLGLLEPRPLGQAIEALCQGQAAHVVILENDLSRRAPAAELREALTAAGSISVLDHVETTTMAGADLVVGVASLAESDGVFVSAEGRAQPFFKAVLDGHALRPSWIMLRDAAIASGRLSAGAWPGRQELLAELGHTAPALASCLDLVPEMAEGPLPPSLPHRYSGRTAITAHLDVREAAPPAHPDSPFAATMEGASGEAFPLNWAPGWNSGQAVLRHRDDVDGAVKGGITGTRLFGEDRKEARYLPLPPVTPPSPDLWLLPRTRIFGSDELSNLAPAIIARTAPPSVALNPQTARQLGLEAGTLAECQVDGGSVRRLVVLDECLPTRVIAVDVGFRGESMIPLPAGGTVTPVAGEAR